jgi:hypothetical protein
MAIEVYTNVLKKVSNAKTLLYTCPVQKSAVIHGFNCSNVTEELILPSFYINNGVDEFTLGKSIKIPPKVTLAWDKPLNLRSGDKIYIQSGPSSSENAHIQMSIMELYDNPFERYRNTCTKLSTSDYIDIYSCPVIRANAIVHGLQFANVGEVHTRVTVDMVDEEEVSFTIGQNIRVPPRTIFVWDKTVNLRPTQKLSVKADIADNIHVVGSLLEIDEVIF